MTSAQSDHHKKKLLGGPNVFTGTQIICIFFNGGKGNVCISVYHVTKFYAKFHACGFTPP